VKDPVGRIIGASKIARDITERKRSEERQDLLINELNHRVKNTLATVQSLAMQTFSSTEGRTNARDTFAARLAALSDAHDVLTSSSWMSASVREVVSRATRAFRSVERLHVSGPDVRIAPKQALALSMALHELLTNAAKHGSLSNETGRVEIDWKTVEDGRGPMIEVTWKESGGPPVSRPTNRGFGSRMIERHLANELGGEVSLEYRREGVFCRMTTALTRAT
jgi:two-component sensor histidine kinase